MYYPSPKTNAVQTTLFTSTRPTEAYSFLVWMSLLNYRMYEDT